VGPGVGFSVGAAVGLAVAQGAAVGSEVGSAVGAAVGLLEGSAVGSGVGSAVGPGVGFSVGAGDGSAVGSEDGCAVGRGDGAAVGSRLAASKTLASRMKTCMQQFEYRSVRQWSKEINGTRTRGRKRKFFNSRRRCSPWSMAAAPVESCQSLPKRCPWGRLGSVLDTRKRLRRMRPGSGHNRPILSALRLI